MTNVERVKLAREEYQPPRRAEMETVWKIRLPPLRNTAARRL